MRTIPAQLPTRGLVTFFPNKAAKTKRQEALPLAQLADLIRSTTAPSKDALPLLKLATFGTQATKPAQCLRNDANVLAVTGIEADYDGELVALDQAVEIMRAAGIESIVYSSPSHTLAAPRWRLLCPTSELLEPKMRARWVSRVNGLFGGIFDPASWTLSQSFYYGSVGGNPDHRVELVPGKPIDHSNLIAGIGPPKAPRPDAKAYTPGPAILPSPGSASYGLTALAGECSAIRTAAIGEQERTLNAAALKCGGLVGGGEMDEGTACADLMAAARSMASAPGRRPWTDREIEAKVRRGLEAGRQTPRKANGAARPDGHRTAPVSAPEARAIDYAPVPPPGPWLQRPRPHAPPTLVLINRDGGPEHVEAPEQKQDAKPRPSSLVLINPTTLLGQRVPEREWIVQDWLPMGAVTANYGDGGTGKSLLAQQLMTSCATLKPWCGLAVTPCRSLALFCEDDADELHRRQDQINDAMGVTFDDLADMRWVSGVGQDNTLAMFGSDGRMLATETFDKVRDAAKAHDARLVTLDTAADTFGGNENDRHQVRLFINLLTRLAMEIRGAVLLNVHPSRTGLSTGNYDGGSTAWSNTVRSRWSLARPVGDDDIQADANERILTRRKANYAPIGESIALRWAKGVLVPVTQQPGVFGSITRQNAEQTFLALLDKCEAQGVMVSHSRNAGNYAPKVFAKRTDAAGHAKTDFEAAMIRLFEAREIRVGGRKDASRHLVQCIIRDTAPVVEPE